MSRPPPRNMNYTGFDLKTIGTQVKHAAPKFYPGMNYIKAKEMKMNTYYYYELRNPCEGEDCIINKFIVQLVDKLDGLPSIRIKIMEVIKNPSGLTYMKNEIYSVPIYSNHTYDGSIQTATYYKMKSPGILANTLMMKSLRVKPDGSLVPSHANTTSDPSGTGREIQLPSVSQNVQNYLGRGGKRKTKKGKNKSKQTKKRKVKTIKKNKKR